MKKLLKYTVSLLVLLYLITGSFTNFAWDNSQIESMATPTCTSNGAIISIKITTPASDPNFYCTIDFNGGLEPYSVITQKGTIYVLDYADFGTIVRYDYSFADDSDLNKYAIAAIKSQLNPKNKSTTQVSGTIKKPAPATKPLSFSTFEYTIMQDGNISIKGKQDISGNITIPAKIDGKNVTKIDNAAFNGSGVTSITIPDGITSIGPDAFMDCADLKSVTIPKSMIKIENCAFVRCNSLTSIKLTDGITSIGDSAFEGCKNLTGITIPDSVTNIGAYAFFDCSNLKSAVIPDSVTSIGDGAFMEEGNILTMYGQTGSFAETYALKNNIPFTNNPVQTSNPTPTATKKDTIPTAAPIVDKVTTASAAVTGKAEIGATITIKVGTKTIGMGAVRPNGTFSISIKPQKAGTTLGITAKDKAENISKATTIKVK